MRSTCLGCPHAARSLLVCLLRLDRYKNLPMQEAVIRKDGKPPMWCDGKEEEEESHELAHKRYP